MHIKRLDIENWIEKLEDRGIKEFQFKDLPDDLKYRVWIQKAKELGLLESINVVNGRHTWKIVPANMPKRGEKQKVYKKVDKRIKRNFNKKVDK